MQKFLFLFLILGCTFSIDAQESQYVAVNGLKIHYKTYGSGPPLLLLHGFTVSSKVWAPWIEDLSKGHQLIVPDLRGHGHSSNPTNKFTHQLSAMDMYALMDQLNIRQFKAIGHSSGGMTLTHMATMDTARIEAMILVASTSFFPDPCRAIQRGSTIESQDENWLTFLRTIHPGGDKQISALYAQFRNMAEVYDDMNFTPPYLATIKCPTLIVHGDRDAFFPIDIPVDSYKAIPNAFLWVIPNEGHIPAGIVGRNSIWSDQFVIVAREFLAGGW